MNEFKSKLNEMMLKDYSAFVKALISIETNIESEYMLDNIYQEFMARDNTRLISDDIYGLIEEFEEDMEL